MTEPRWRIRAPAVDALAKALQDSKQDARKRLQIDAARRELAEAEKAAADALIAMVNSMLGRVAWEAAVPAATRVWTARAALAALEQQA